MAEWAVREMVADWLGAERSANKFTPTSLQSWTWFNKARGEMRLHSDTASLLDRILAEYFAVYGG